MNLQTAMVSKLKICISAFMLMTFINIVLFMGSVKYYRQRKSDKRKNRLVINLSINPSESVPVLLPSSVVESSTLPMQNSTPRSHRNVPDSTKCLPNNHSLSINNKKNVCRDHHTKSSGLRTVAKDVDTWSGVEQNCSFVASGGRFWPKECKPIQRVAIIVPYRNRDEQLRIFLRHIHSFMKSQPIYYGVFIIEQNNGTLFNRGMLLNIGFIETLKLDAFDCFIFHDVDLLPENTKNTYMCGKLPLHLSVAVDKFHYKLPYRTIFGGVTAMRKQHMLKVNGYSNVYFGWGGEDDDMYRRLRKERLLPRRPTGKIGRYTMLKHKKETRNPKRNGLLRNATVVYKDVGITNLKYKLIGVECKKLYTRVRVLLEQSDTHSKHR